MAWTSKCYEKFKVLDAECNGCKFLTVNDEDGYCGAECLDCGGTLIAKDVEGLPMYRCNGCNVQFWHYDLPTLQGETEQHLMQA